MKALSIILAAVAMLAGCAGTYDTSGEGARGVAGERYSDTNLYGPTNSQVMDPTKSIYFGD